MFTSLRVTPCKYEKCKLQGLEMCEVQLFATRSEIEESLDTADSVASVHKRRVDSPINFISGRKSLAESIHKGQITPRVVERSTVRDEPVILLGDMLLSGQRVLAGRLNCYMVPYKQEADDLNKPPVHAFF